MKMAIILFDGVCNFCDQSVQFIIRHDKKKVFQFASIQSEKGKELLIRHGVHEEVDSIVLIEDKRAFTESDAVIRISSRLRFPYSLGKFARIIPRRIRDVAYKQFAKRRYKWFGQKDQCSIPSKEVRDRFLS
ncbi:thiol-disulfide oxidoreductase [Bacillus sp. Leaf406]|nr:thiol-disulfide oxidoreductase [Bacillus sp. Leaf406]